MNYTKKIGGDSENMIRWFSEISKEDASLVGNKAANLGEISNAGFPVPRGFVITTESFEHFLSGTQVQEKINSIIESVDIENTEQLVKGSLEIRNLIEKEEIPKDLRDEIIEAYKILSSEKINTLHVSQNALTILKNSEEPIFVAVRSSVTNEDTDSSSYAGLYDSFLYVKGERNLIEHVKKCFSSLFSARAIYYRKKKGLNEDKPKIGVIIMKMIDSEKAGVIFSSNPIGDSNEIMIESVYGLCEGLNSGKIKPDHYLVSKDLVVKDIQVSDKKIAVVRSGSGLLGLVRLVHDRSNSQVLTNGQISEVANYSLRLEELFNKPQNIEFGIEGNKFFVLQSRPITKIAGIIKDTKSNINSKLLLEGTPASPGVISGIVKIINSSQDLFKVKKGDIIITEVTSPETIVAMKKVSGIVTNEGGATSHASIVARELGIPCIVGAKDSTLILKDGMKISIDGYSGKIFEGEIVVKKIVKIKPAVNTEKVKLRLLLDSTDDPEDSKESKLDSVGLLKIEGFIEELGKHPLYFEKLGKLDEYTSHLIKKIEGYCKPFKNIFVSTSDIKSDELQDLEGSPALEKNPMLGLRGIRFSLKHPEIFESEIKAVAELAKKYPDKNFGILLPQVISIKEVKSAKEIFEKYKEDNLDLGVIIETPSSVQIIESICSEGVKLIAIGTENLMQYTLAVDRDHEDIKHLYDEMHPALFSQIRRIIGSTRRNRIESAIYGKFAMEKETIELVFKEGVNEIFVKPENAEDISMTIAELERLRNEAYEKKKSEKKDKNQKNVSNERKTEDNNKRSDKNYQATKYQEDVNNNDELPNIQVPPNIEGYKEVVFDEGIDNTPIIEEKDDVDRTTIVEKESSEGEYAMDEGGVSEYKRLLMPDNTDDEMDIEGEAEIRDLDNEEKVQEAIPEIPEEPVEDIPVSDILDLTDVTPKHVSEDENLVAEDSGIDDVGDTLELRKKNHYSYFDEDYR